MPVATRLRAVVRAFVFLALINNLYVCVGFAVVKSLEAYHNAPALHYRITTEVHLLACSRKNNFRSA